MSDFTSIRDNALRLIAKNQKLKLNLKKYEEIIIKYVDNVEKLINENEELKGNLDALQEEFDNYKQNVKDNYRPLTPKELGWE